MSAPEGVPHLVLVAPDSERTRRIELRRDYIVVGRETSCDVRFDDPHVSRTHAALQRRGNAVYVRDLGSSGGTFIGGTAVTTARELHPGDVITFGTVKARFEPASAAGRTIDVPGGAAALSPLIRGRRRNGRAIGRAVGRAASSHVQRENLLREIAVTKTKALWLSWTGLLVFAEGFIIIAVTDLNLLHQQGTAIQNGDTELPQHRFGPDVAGIPGGLLGWALAVVGLLLLAAGIGLHIAAASRRRRIDLRHGPL